MELLFAPMEGVTGQRFRQAHHRWFGGVDQYYIPFIAPTQDPKFTRRDLAELLPEQNAGIRVVPQLLTKSVEDFMWAALALADMGYEEVNLNLGCPSGTVVAKKKGSGFLADRDMMRAFFDEVFARCPIGISIKTRLGLTEPEEFEAILAVYNDYPIKELTVHPRVRTDFYRNPVRREWFDYAVANCRHPLCYNGDLNTPGEVEAFCREYPAIDRIMVGRGLVGDPALGRVLKGGKSAERDEVRGFHDELFHAYRTDFQSDRNAIFRMKELWFYLACLFDGGEKQVKRIRKATRRDEYEAAVTALLEEVPLRRELVKGW